MSKLRQFTILVLMCVTPFVVHTSAPRVIATVEPEWPAVDDGCEPGYISEVEPGWDYVNGVWIDADGATIGYAPEEDSCIRPVIDDLAPRAVPVRQTVHEPPATLPVTL